MSQQEIIRAWKDAEFRNSLSEAQRSQLPKNPAGMVELSDKDLETFAGGSSYTYGEKLTGTSNCHLE